MLKLFYKAALSTLQIYYKYLLVKRKVSSHLIANYFLTTTGRNLQQNDFNLVMRGVMSFTTLLIKCANVNFFSSTSRRWRWAGRSVIHLHKVCGSFYHFATFSFEVTNHEHVNYKRDTFSITKNLFWQSTVLALYLNYIGENSRIHGV